MSERPKLLIIAGPNGAGKTSVTGKILTHEWIEGCVYINPDNIARDVFGDWNSSEAVMNAAKYATQLREDCLVQGKSILFETVLSSPEKLNFIERAQQADYFIRLFFVGTDTPAINAARIAQRMLNGGHGVPIEKIISRYAKSIANCAAAAKTVDRMYAYDNSVNDAFPKLLFRTADGQLKKIYGEVNEWARGILDTINYNVA